MTEKENPYSAPGESGNAGSPVSIPPHKQSAERYGPYKMALVSWGCFCTSIVVFVLFVIFDIAGTSGGRSEHVLGKEFVDTLTIGAILGTIAFAAAGVYSAFPAGSREPSQLSSSIISVILFLLNLAWLSLLIGLTVNFAFN